MARAAGDSRTYSIAVVDDGGHQRSQAIQLPSVTTVLKALPKQGLDWYGYKMGLEAARKLHERGEFVGAADIEALYETAKAGGRQGGDVPTPSNQLAKASQKGTDVHDLAEQLFKAAQRGDKNPRDVLPAKSTIEEANLPKVEAAVMFYEKTIEELKCEVVKVEAAVFSLRHRYAGTLDLLLKQPLGRFGGSGPVVVDSATGKVQEDAVATWLYNVVDFKTSKAIYESHLIQGTAYEAACREMGHIPENAVSQASVCRLGGTKTKGGEYELKTSPCTLEDFLAVYRMWQVLEATSGKKVW